MKITYRIHEVVYHRADGKLEYDYYPQWSSDDDVWHAIDHWDVDDKESAIRVIKEHREQLEDANAGKVVMIQHNYLPVTFEGK